MNIELNVLVDGGFQKIDIKNKNEITKHMRIVLCAKKVELVHLDNNNYNIRLLFELIFK